MLVLRFFLYMVVVVFLYILAVDSLINFLYLVIFRSKIGFQFVGVTN